MVNSKYKIYLDLDGVLADWEKQFKNFSGGVSSSEYESRYGKEQRYELVKKNSPNFYETIPWTKDGKSLYFFAKQFPTEILSHSTDEPSSTGKLNWLKNNNIDLKPNLVKNRLDKSKFASADSILIDDRSDVIESFIKSGGIGILHKNSAESINKLKEILGVKESHRLYNSILNPEMWDEKILKADILNKLLKISTEFYKDTELTAPIEDIYFLGSSAGYNWSPTSDIDLHILIDFNKVDENRDLVKKLVDAYKNKWNEHHDININNHKVEVYIQDISDVNKSQAVYSILKNEWVLEPSYKEPVIDKELIKTKYRDYVSRIDGAINSKDLTKMKELVEDIYKMRESGLVSGGEYSSENLVFKLLRSTGYISKLRLNINDLVDKDLNKS